ncbi:cytochrome P450 3A24-like [Olea europaea subsp. europaea]|uniref:Cytochrome P450 3A24-like n=1 Tax=Olea europaea subsp. europaea TaxID=158383 RepID=A0A8S0V5P3_OLEEU|nr:cytochrome P450 3A24-like [Olea europaea subsp. europaea]
MTTNSLGLDASGLLAGLALVLTAACVYFHLKAFSYWSSRGIRGPTPWPIFGTNIYYLLGNKLEVDTRWRKEFGKTYGIYEGYLPTLRTSDNELIKSVFVKQHSSFTDRNNKFTHEPVQRSWLLWSDGERWANQRALVSPMFSSAKMRPWVPLMSSCFDHFRTEVDSRLAKQKQKQKHDKNVTLNKTDLGCLLLDLISSSFFGLRVDTYKDTTNEFLVQARAFAKLTFARFLGWLLLPRPVARYFEYELVPYKRYEYFDLLTKRIVEERRTKRQGPQKQDFVQLFLDAKLPDSYEPVFNSDDDREAHYNDQMKHEQLEEVQRGHASGARMFKKFTDLEIRGQMTFMFVAGFETTTSTINFCLYELAHKPHLQQVLLDELVTAFGGRKQAQEVATRGFSSLRDNKETIDLLVGLKCLDAFASETLRLYAPIIEVNRLVSEEGGVSIPGDSVGQSKPIYLERGTPVSVNPFILHRDDDYFPSPTEFQLDRFLPENRDKIKGSTFMPFGLGPRHCVGMRFALLSVKLIIARTILNYVISPGPNTTIYPPAGFQQNFIFLLPHANDFRVSSRVLIGDEEEDNGTDHHLSSCE